MSYDSLIKEFVDGIYWNIDHLFNYLSFNFIKPFEVNVIPNNTANYVFSNLRENMGSFNVDFCDFQYLDFDYQTYLSNNYPTYNYFDRDTLDFYFINIQDYWFLARENRFYLRFESQHINTIDQFFNVDCLNFDYLNLGIQEFLDLIFPILSYKSVENQNDFIQYLTYNYTYLFQYNSLHNYKSLNVYVVSQEISKFIYFYSPIFLSFNHFLSNLLKGSWIHNFNNISLIHDEFIKSILNENIFFNIQSTGSLTVLQLPTYVENKFFIGFLNSIFLSLPFSCNQLLSFYTFLTRGPFLGFISTLGWIIGQLSLFGCVFFGFKPLILQWFGLEPLNYFLGIYLIVIFLRESLDKIKKEESRALKIKKKYEKSLSSEKFDILLKRQEKEDDKDEVEEEKRLEKEKEEQTEIIRKREKLQKLRIQRENKKRKKEKKKEKKKIKRQTSRLKRINTRAIKVQRKEKQQLRRKEKRFYLSSRKSGLFKSIFTRKKKRFRKKIQLKRKRFQLALKKRIFKLKRRKRQILQTTKRVFKTTKKLIHKVTGGCTSLKRKIKIGTKKTILKSKRFNQDQIIEEKYYGDEDRKLKSEEEKSKEEIAATPIYNTRYRPSLLMNARKILKRKKLRRMLISPKKKASIKTTSSFKRIKPGKIFAFHFLLAWTENGHLFSYLNSLNFGTGSSLLDISFTTNLNEYIILHLTYLIGIFFGCLFFSYLYNKAFLRFYFRVFKIRYMNKELIRKLKRIARLGLKRRRKKQRRYQASDFYTPLKTIKKDENKLRPRDLIDLPLKPTASLMKRFKRTKTLRLKKQKTFIDKEFIKEKSNDEKDLEISENRTLRKARKFYRKFIEFTDTLANMNSIYFSKHAKYFVFDREVILKEKIEENFQKYFNEEYRLFKTVFTENKKIIYLGNEKKKQENKTKASTSKKILTIIRITFKIIPKILKFGVVSLSNLVLKILTKGLPSLIRSIPRNIETFLKNILKMFSFSHIKNVFQNLLFNFSNKEKKEIILSTPNLLETNLKKDTSIFIGRKLIIRRITTILFTLIVGITMSSLSYYDVSYLLTRPLGFIPQDQRISRTIMNSNSDDVCEYGLSNDRDLYQMIDNNFLYTDIMSIDSKEYKNGLAYEQVNYQAEYSWASRSDSIKRTGFKYYQNEVRKQPKFRDNICISEKDIYLAELEYDEIEELQTRDFFEKKENIDPILARIYDPPAVTFEANPFGDNTTKDYRDKVDTNFKIEFLPIDLDSELFQWDEDDYIVDAEIGEEVKQNYYQNNIYKMLLNGEIDAFISRQPKDLILSEFEENELFSRRKAISNYYESNFYYSKMNHFDAFRNIFFDSKSSLNTTYNQQFKGTLNIIQRLFPISLDNNNIRSVLKYDLPLINKTNQDHFSHEELLSSGKSLSSNYKGLLSTTVSPLFIKWNNHLNQLVLTNNLILKETNNLDIYEPSSPFQKQYLFDSFNMLNLQKFTSLIRNSYSIIQCPSLGLLGPSSDSTLKLTYLLDKFDLPLEEATQDYLMKIGIQPNPDLRLLDSWFNRFNWYSFRYRDTLPFKDQTEAFGDNLEHAVKGLYYRDNLRGQQLEYKYRKGVNQFNKLNPFILDEASKNKMNERIKNYLIEDENLKNIYDEDQLNILLFFGETFD